MNPYTTTGGPYSNGFWLIDISRYTSQSGFTYLTVNISAPVVPLYWLGRISVNSSGAMAFYSDTQSNIALSYYTTGGSFIQVASPS